MLSCKNVIRLLNTSEELPIFKKVELRMHLLMCKSCTHYSKHLQMIGDRVRDLFGKSMKADPQAVADLERKVLEKLDRKKS